MLDFSGMSTNYGASNITVLEGLEAVRKRPGMYIGNTGKEGLHRCLGEILDNSVDEYMAGHATTIKVLVRNDTSILISDDGRGIPTDIHAKTGKSAVETIMTVLHAGGKFDQANYQFSGGLHGVGASVVNALSEKMQIWVLRDKKVHYIPFSKGKVTAKMIDFESDLLASKFPEIIEHLVWDKSGTVTTFWPDKTMFETTSFNVKEIEENLKQTAYLNKGIKIIFEVEAADGTSNLQEFCYPKGIFTFLEDVTKGESLQTPIIHLEAKTDNFQMELAMTYSSDYNERLFAFTNGIINPEGGAHVTGFKSALTKLINNYASSKNYFKKDERFTSDDLKEGVRVVLSIKMTDPQFTSQSKVKLGSTIARTITDRMVTERLGTFLEENPSVGASVVQKAQLAMKARLAAKSARDNILRKGVLDSMALPGKLADCSEKDPEKSEIFIVEGDSAGGSAKQGRDRNTQAILPLRGKVLNTEKATLDRILNYEGIKNMIIAFGTGIGDKFDIDKLRYHKIVLMTDADVDGAHITTLLLTFLYRYMPVLIEDGYIYMARPPLYKIQWGKKFEYVYSDVEKEALLKRVNSANPDKDIKFEIQRYKGLGEMNPEQLWETTMNPVSRMLYQVTVGEAAIADKVFEDLMGSEVEPRKKFIDENAIFADVDMV
ncbi:MAG: DNA gyrase subunit B [Patescibacteria group bacterium]